MGDFFKRPVKIDTFEWSPSTELSRELNPWFSYFKNKRVINRIANYNLLSANMCVKFLINGNPFYFGRAMVYYAPLHSNDAFGFELNAASSIFKNVLRSQHPKIFLDPTESQAGCMELPFYYPYNAIKIPDDSWSLGQLRIRELSALKHANGASDPIQITVYAWCKDINLSVPTSDQPALTAQSGTADEYGDGVVSNTAIAVSKVAGKLSSVPVIGPYARATEMAARGVGDVAKAFGYSRPSDITSVGALQQSNFDNLAIASGSVVSHKLTFDPKSEVTIDPTVTGLDSTDEMNMDYLFKKESYLTSVLWGSADVANVRLGEILVTPRLFNYYGPTGGHFMTSMCHAALPFRFWRGNIKFRLQIVASKFHKGRLLVSWDPGYFKSEEENIQYSRIVDISEDRDITFEIGWGQPAAYAEVGGLTSTIPFRLRTSAFPTSDSRTNGILSVRVLNPLAVATDASLNNDVDINVFVSAGDGFEVFNPVGPPSVAPFQDQSYDGPYQDQSDVMDAPAPDKQSEETIGATVMDKSALIYHGDPVISLRQLLKRFTRGYTIPYNFNTDPASPLGPQTSRYFLTAMVPFFGYNPASIHKTSTSVPFCFWRPNNINYYACAYKGYRGTIRHKFYVTANTPEGNPVSTTIALGRTPSPLNIGPGGLIYNGDSNASASAQVRMNYLNGFGTVAGAAVSQLSNNNQITVDVPYMTKARFALCRDNKLFNQSTALAEHPSFTTYTTVATPGIDPDFNQITGNTFIAAGEDFSLSFHVGPPILYSQSIPNAEA